MNINKILKNKKIMGIIGATTLVLLVGGVILCQTKYNAAIVYASDLGALGTVDHYQDLGLLVKPDTVQKMYASADEEAATLASQAKEIFALETALDTDLAVAMTMNDIEKESLATIEADYSESKSVYNEEITVESGAVYITSLTGLQTRLDELQASNKARLDKEAADKKAKEEAEAQAVADAEAEQLPYYGDDSTSSNGSSSGSSNGGSSSGGSNTPSEPVSNPGKYTCSQIAADWGVSSIPGCSTMEADGIQSYGAVYDERGDYWSYGIESNNYSYAWFSDTGDWSIVTIDGWNLVTSGVSKPNYN